jgi:hypothetical protein
MKKSDQEAIEKDIDEAINTGLVGTAGSDTAYRGGLEALRLQLKLSLWAVQAARDSARWSLWASIGSLLAALVALLAYGWPHLISR